MSARRAGTAGSRAALAAALLLTSSCGTLLTRVAAPLSVELGNRPPIGWYPGTAVVVDAVLVSKLEDLTWGGDSDELAVYALTGLLSLPVDLVVDTALLPLDLLGALVGWKKVARS